MHDDRALVEKRLRRALDERIRPAIYGPACPLAVSAWEVDGPPVPVAAGLAGDYQPTGVGEAWGPPWSTTWFQLSGTVPAPWAGEQVEAVVDLGGGIDHPGFSCEGLVYSEEGVELKGLTDRSLYVPAPAAGPVRFYVEAAANPRVSGVGTPLGDPATAGRQPLYRLRRAELAVFHRPVWDLVIDTEVLAGLMAELATDDPRRHLVLRALERMLDRLDLGDVAGTATDAAKELAGVLAQPAVPSAHHISAVGNAHIDSAWLWPLRETHRKVQRTVANALALADSEPGYLFAFSQAQQLAWLKEDRPGLYERLRAAVAAGRVVPVGGLWVEPDGNLPSGEALARQMIYGKRFFMEEFGVETREVWLPDSFGYSAAIPQLARLAGNRWMLTQKLSWNQTNRFPHHTFWWEGIDGSRLFTHFPPVDSYNAELTPAELAHATRNYAEHGRGGRSLVPFGYGDGGGGPTREMLAAARRVADLEGMPRVTVESPAAFFQRAEVEYPDAPVWSGELYLELHRGTFTTQARVKRANRRCEQLLHEAELWAATATLRTGADYPYDLLEELWKQVLLLQFHDILPGTSIAWVYQDAERMYAEVADRATQVVDAALAALAGAGEEGEGSTVRFNAAPHARDGVPAFGASAAPAPAAPPATVKGPDDAGGFLLDNGLLRVRLDAAGLVTSVTDLVAEREALAPGATGNLLQLHPDLPNYWDAWDVERFYRNTHVDLADAESVTAAEAGPVRAAVRVVRRFGSSLVEETLSVDAGARALRVETVVDWHEQEKFLKVAWPLDVHAGVATSEIQFGHVQRPTHSNTSWDAARFEVPSHRWVHVGEAGYGVAITNTATYGHDVTRTTRPDGGTTTTLRLSLLRGPRFPDPGADQGQHRFSYLLHPGASVADAVREGYRTNLRLREVKGRVVPEPVVAVDGDQAVVETVKLADDRSGDLVVRLYESLGGQARTVLRPGFTAADVVEVDLLERPVQRGTAVAALRDGQVPLRLRPFQIVTLRLRAA